MPLSESEGKEAVGLARRVLEAHVKGEPQIPGPVLDGVFREARGVFVTLNQADDSPERLRGCIGFPYPSAPLGSAIVDATVAAASEDPRFPPVSTSELASLVVEVSVLTEPHPLEATSPTERPGRIRIGKDGLIVSRRNSSGLLLPQVATEFGLSQEDFLTQGCLKAGLPPSSWLDPETKVSVFQAEVFAEEKPRGRVSRVD